MTLHVRSSPGARSLTPPSCLRIIRAASIPAGECSATSRIAPAVASGCGRAKVGVSSRGSWRCTWARKVHDRGRDFEISRLDRRLIVTSVVRPGIGQFSRSSVRAAERPFLVVSSLFHADVRKRPQKQAFYRVWTRHAQGRELVVRNRALKRLSFEWVEGKAEQQNSCAEIGILGGLLQEGGQVTKSRKLVRRNRRKSRPL